MLGATRSFHSYGRAVFRRLVGIAVVCSAWSNTALASAGCDNVNSGAWNMTLSISATGYTPLLNFSVGETVRLTVTELVSSGGIYLMDGSAGVLGSTSGSGSVSHTVTGPNDLSMVVGLASGTSFFAEYAVVATCDTSAGPGPNTDASRSVTRGFLHGRINGLLLNDPMNTRLLNRSSAGSMTTGTGTYGPGVASNARGSGGAVAMGLGAGALDDAAHSGGTAVQFSQSLSQLRRRAADEQMEKHRMALGAGASDLPVAAAPTSPWDLWVEGRYSAFNDDNGNLGRDGHLGVLYVGGDYRVSQNMIVGMLGQFDWAKDESDALSSKVEGDGWMIGPYLSAQIHQNIYFDLRAAWGQSSNDLTLGTTTGDFDTSRWLVKGTLAGNWVYGGWRITPSAELAYITENQSAFVNSAGTVVRSQDVSLGRLQFGPEFGYRIAQSADTFIEPFVALKGVWDFDNPDVAIINGEVIGAGDFWGRLQGGLNVATTNGWSVRGLASWDGVGASDYNGYTLQGSVNVPLN